MQDRQMRDLIGWSERTGYSVEILKSAIRRGDLVAERPSGFERGRLYVSVDEMVRWIDSIRASV